MGHKIFISYKYYDNNVAKLNNKYDNQRTVRDYVDYLADLLEDKTDNIYKGEDDGEDLSELSEDTIWEKLKGRIYDSTVTIVMISPNMKENKSEMEQWIPWEISYSLKEENRKNSAGNTVTSKSNAIIALVLPDRNNSYSYFLEYKNCCEETCRLLKTDTLFKILKENMFNIKKPNKYECDENSTIYKGDCSYILTVRWFDFIKNAETMDEYIEKALKLQNSIEKYDISCEID